MDEHKKCPACAEEIKVEAIKCKHCGEMVNTSPPLAPVSLHQMDLAPFMLPGLVAAVGMLMFGYAMVMDVTVAVPGGATLGIDRVANIHLISQQANLRNGGAFVFVMGMIWGVMKGVRPVAATGRAPVEVAAPMSQNRILGWIAAAIVLILMAAASI